MTEEMDSQYDHSRLIKIIINREYHICYHDNKRLCIKRCMDVDEDRVAFQSILKLLGSTPNLFKIGVEKVRG